MGIAERTKLTEPTKLTAGRKLSQRKAGLTLEQHEHAAEVLHDANRSVLSVLTMLSKAYSVNGKELRRHRQARDALGELHNVLDSAMFREHGDAASLGTYYGRNHAKPVSS